MSDNPKHAIIVAHNDEGQYIGTECSCKTREAAEKWIADMSKLPEYDYITWSIEYKDFYDE